MGKITEDEFVGFVEKMPAFPQNVHKLIQLSANDDAPIKDIVAVIESDPVMTVKILKVANSAFYNLPHKITSIQRALVHLGINSIKNLALSVAAIGVLPTENKADFDTNLFLEHSLATAVLSKKLAERMGVSSLRSSDFFVAGLLHDFGKIVFAEFVPVQFKQALEQSRNHNIDLHIAEIEYVGMSHAQAGYMLALKWGLAKNLAVAIEQHHNSNQADLLCDCVFAANQMAKMCKFGYAGNLVVESFSAEAQALFGKGLDELITELGDISVIKTEVQQLIGV